MPKSTFFNLNSEKKQKIEEAIKNEFKKNSFEKASISNIIEMAQIPRGSFYQYFESKEDALIYIIQKFMDEEKEFLKKSLIKNEGNIFDTIIDIYDYILEKKNNEKETRLLQNIIMEVKNNNFNLFINMKCEKKYINEQILNIKDEEEMIYIMKILYSILKTEIIEVICGRKTKQLGKQELIKEIEMLKIGLAKNL